MTDQVPVSIGCSLTARELQGRERDWRAAIDDGLVARERVPGGVRLTFRPDLSLLHDLVELVDAERRCCGWASWTLTSTAGEAVVDVTADEDGAPMLWALFQVQP